jgi:Tol biopolymer transport system component
MRPYSRRGCAALVTAVLATATLSSTLARAADATFEGKNGRIAYTVSYDSGHRHDIFTVRPDGTGETRLTFSRNSAKPLWSPFGRRIAYERADAVWIMQADGSGKQPLIPGRLVGWMPNGGRILVVRGLGGPDGVDPTWLLVRISTGEAEHLPIDLPLVAGLEPPYDDYDQWSSVWAATLSPNGDRLALFLTRPDVGPDGYDYGYSSVFSVRLDGTGLGRIGSVYLCCVSSSPVWSPRGRQLVYSYVAEPRANCEDAVTSVRLNGRHGSSGFGGLCDKTDPVWSPDRDQIAFAADSPQRVHHTLRIANLDGSQITKVLSSTVRSYSHPDWRSLP